MPRANPDVNYEISIHALLAESDRSLLLPVRGSRISIHALLAESDARTPCRPRRSARFLSTLSLRRATTNIREGVTVLGVFLSTLSLRRATQALKRICGRYHKFLSTLSLRRATCAIVCIRCVRSFLSTLSLRRATLYGLCLPPVGKTFLSTLSLRRATEQSSSYNAYLEISIHALLAESDQ